MMYHTGRAMDYIGIVSWDTVLLSLFLTQLYGPDGTITIPG